MQKNWEKRGVMRYSAIIILVIANILVLTLLIPKTSSIPQDFSINGRLTDSSGNPQKGTLNFTFRIYVNESGGTALWSSINQTVTADSNGVFTARLTNLSLNFSEQYYLGIQVANDAEMTPRINLTSSAYSFRAQNVSIEGVEFVRNVNVGNNNLTVNGTTFFVNTNLGRVGIGTITPEELVVFASSIDADLNLMTASNSDQSSLHFVRARGSLGALEIVAQGDNVLNMIGRVYNGSTYFNAVAIQATIDGVPGGNDLPTNLQFGTTPDNSSSRLERMRITHTGDVGIGTKSPQARLHINATNATGGNAGGMIDALRVTNATGSELLFVNATSGNVGIGTTGPDTKLQVGAGSYNTIGGNKPGGVSDTVTSIADNTALNTVAFNLGVSDGSRNSRAEFFLTDATANNGGWGLWQTYSSGGSQPFVIGQGGSEVFRITSTGNVGIGTTAPSALLHINGTSNAALLNITNNTRPIVFVNGQTERVGIGTTTPTHTLTVSGDLNVTGSSYLGNLVLSSDSISTNNITSKTGNISLYSDLGTEVLKIDGENDRVGIGTAVPGSKLNVVGQTVLGTAVASLDSYEALDIVRAGDAYIFLRNTNAGGVNNGGLIDFYQKDGGGTERATSRIFGSTDSTHATAPGGRLTFSTMTNGGSLTERMRIDDDGNVGIGTTAPSALLHINGTSNAALLNITNNTRPIVFVNGQTERVGIGTTSPAVKLEVEDTTTNVTLLRLQDSDGTCDHNPEVSSEVVSCSSDIRLKENIRDASSVLDDIMKIKIREFRIISSKKTSIGVIAQEMREVLPELVHEKEDGILMVQQISNWKIIKAIQEQQEQINALKAKGSVASANENLHASIGNKTLVTVKNSATFKDAVFTDHVTLGKDTMGETIIPAGSIEVQIKFKSAYKYPPIVTLTPLEFIDGQYKVAEKTARGFKIVLQNKQSQSIAFDWHAFESS